MTSLDDHVYVVRKNTKKVEDYDAVALTLERCLPVRGISFDISGIAACSRSKCLYLSDWKNPNIHRMDLDTVAMKTWRVGGKPKGLSVTEDHNVLVACAADKKLQEYTTDGSLVREICLLASVGPPWNAIQLSTGDYVVSHCVSPGMVSVVGADGRVLRSYEPSISSDVGPMKYPKGLAVTKHGDILVADENNNRILAINFSLNRAQVFHLPADVGLRRPCALYLDNTRDRLYIGEMGGKHRVILLNDASCISWQL